MRHAGRAVRGTTTEAPHSNAFSRAKETIMTSRQTPSEAIEQLRDTLPAYLNAVPALFWRIDIIKNEITLLNTHRLPGLAEKSDLLIKNMTFARELVLTEDWPRFRECFDSIRSRRPMSGIFRITNSDGTLQWIKMAGMPDPVFSCCSVGFLMDFTRQMNSLHILSERPGLATKIDLFDTPVILLRFHDRRVAMANAAARAMLGYTEQELRALDVKALLGATTSATLHAAYESLIFSDSWNGEVSITDKSGAVHVADARIRAIARDGQNLLWLALNPASAPVAHRKTPEPQTGLSVPDIAGAMHASTSLRDLLAAILHNLPSGTGTNAVMLSRIFPDNDTIQVTGAGLPFEGVRENDTHSYTGSIAENIVQFGLTHLVVNDTSRSIKPIDWALFIPRGIRSYYAQPFFKDGEICFVLIFCSTTVGNYDEDSPALFSPIFTDFQRELQRCLSIS